MAAREFDLIIRGGTIADGSGARTFEADVGVKDGLIAEVGKIAKSGREEISAKGLLVTPGFVDIHTHYDGQVTWERTLRPSSLHGVTTVVMGNCGVGFAPCRPEQHDMLIRVMEGVEDIPGVVMAEGIPWKWESFPEFLDFLEQRECDIDFATQVPHGPVRVYVMGKRGADREPATDHDMAQMTAIVRDAIEAGALGFTTSRTMIHRTRDGALAPTITAAEEELRAIALGLKSIGKGVLQMVDDFNATSDERSPEFAMWCRIVEESARPLSFSLVQRSDAPERWRVLLKLVEKANRRGLTIRGQVCGRPIGLLFGLELSFHPFSACPGYRDIAHLPLAQRLEAMRDPSLRARLIAENPGGISPELTYMIRSIDQMFEFADPPDYSPSPAERLSERAKRANKSELELAYDILISGSGKALLYFPVGNFADGNLDAALKMLKHPLTVIGIGDGGAHLGMICDASLPTHMLTYWTRDRRGARLEVEDAIRILTRDTAQIVGLNDRGVIAPGYVADLNVIDYDRLFLHRPTLVKDLPAGGQRLTQRATGFVATIKKGGPTYRDGNATGALPGRLIRGAQPAPRSIGRSRGDKAKKRRA